MKRTTTPDYFGPNNCDLDMYKEKKIINLQPRKQTLDMIMQFARSYHVVGHLPKNISGMILN